MTGDVNGARVGGQLIGGAGHGSYLYPSAGQPGSGGREGGVKGQSRLFFSRRAEEGGGIVLHINTNTHTYILYMFF